jgi:hypothetical protein
MENWVSVRYRAASLFAFPLVLAPGEKREYVYRQLSSEQAAACLIGEVPFLEANFPLLRLGESYLAEDNTLVTRVPATTYREL